MSFTHQQALDAQSRMDRSRKRQPVPAHETGKQGNDRESKVRAEILAYCAKQWPVWLVSTSRTDEPSTLPVGWPDMVIFGPHPIVIIAELKSASGKLSPEQRAFVAQFKHIGWTVHVIRSFSEFSSIVAQGKLLHGKRDPDAPTIPISL